MQRFIIETVLRSDFLFWAALNTIPDQMTATLLATEPALIAAATPAERERADRILWEIFPVSSRAEGLLNDARLAGNPAQTELSGITAPTLTISVDDDRFGTDDAARYIAAPRGKADHLSNRRTHLDRPQRGTMGGHRFLHSDSG